MEKNKTCETHDAKCYTVLLLKPLRLGLNLQLLVSCDSAPRHSDDISPHDTF